MIDHKHLFYYTDTTLSCTSTVSQITLCTGNLCYLVVVFGQSDDSKLL